MRLLHGGYQSFAYALRGLSVLFLTQRNARVHLLATLAAVAGGLLAELAASEWILLTLTVTAVIVTEALNTAVEFLADAVVPEQHPLIERSKDIAAAAVLLAALAAVIVGALLFGPKIW
jgi:diacylglycerol kinase